MTISTCPITTIPIPEVITLIRELQNAELCRDYRESQRLLSPLWPDMKIDPVFTGIPSPIEAELLRLSGAFLSLYARAKNKRNMILRGKDLLSRSISIFEKEGAVDKAAEAKIMLGHCYWLTGEIEESHIIFDEVETSFDDNHLHPVYLQAKIYRLMIHMWSGEFAEALPAVKDLATTMSFCKDMRLIAMYHNHAGRIYQGCGEIEEAEFHYAEAIRTARTAGNDRFAAMNLNNLAFLFNDVRRFDDGLVLVDQAIKQFTELGDTGAIPHAMDTKALLLLNRGQSHLALDVIDEALNIFKQGEDHAGYVDSMWTRCRCLLSLGRTPEVLQTFAELYQKAAVQIGKKACVKYTELLAAELYPVTGLPLTEEVATFKKSRVANALRLSANNIQEASRALGLKSHQALSEILNKQFPELYDELNLSRRKRRSDARKDPVRGKPRPVVRDTDLAPIKVDDFLIEADEVDRTNIAVYYASSRLLEQTGIACDCIIAVLKKFRYINGCPILYEYASRSYCSRVEFDTFARFFIVDCPGSDIPLPLGDDIKIIGSPVGYFPVQDFTSGQNVDFYRFPGT